MNKHQKAELRRLAELAHERELGHGLGHLRIQFDEWRDGGMPASELCGHVREFLDGPAREARSRQAALKTSEARVAWGLAHRWLAESEVDPALLDAVRNAVEVFREISRFRD